MNKRCIELMYGIFVSALIYRVEVQYVEIEKNLCNQKGNSNNVWYICFSL